MAHAELLRDSLVFGEGPRWHDDRLWYSDFGTRLVMTLDLDGHAEPVVEVPGRPSGLGWLPDGRLLVVSMEDRRVLRLDPGGLVPHAELAHIATWHCNDMLVDARGRAYVGNFGVDYRAWIAEHGVAALRDPGLPPTVVARVDPHGAVHVAAGDLRFPNGMVVTPDGGTLIVAETFGARLTAFDVAADGSLSNRRAWARIPRSSPDGICLDAAGAVWVANAIAPECLRVAEGGEILERVETSQRCFACMLGGPDRRTLFMLTAPVDDLERGRELRGGKIEVTQVEAPGAGWP
jgi:sugar lactone lactonase YvrE